MVAGRDRALARVFGVAGSGAPALWERAGLEFEEGPRETAERALLTFVQQSGLSGMPPRERVQHLADFVLENAEAGRRASVLLGLDLLSRLPRAERLFLATLLAAAKADMSPRMWRIMAVARPRTGALPEKKRNAFRRLFLRKRPGSRTDVDGLILPELVTTWPEALAKIQSDHLETETELLRWTFGTADRGGLSFEEYVARARYGEALGRLSEDLIRFRPFAAEDAAPAANPRRQAMMALAKDMARHVIPFSQDAVRAHQAAGRSTLITITHSGFMSVMRGYAWNAVPDLTILGSAEDRGSDSGTETRRISVRQGDGTAIARLVAEARRKPQIVGVAADILGDYRPEEVDFLGRPMLINPRPGALAFAMRAALFHAEGVYEDGRIRIRLVPGPVVEQGMTMEDWAPLYRRFLLSRLEETAKGAPENLYRWKRTMRGMLQYDKRGGA